METITSCCGVICSQCEYYPADCKGCPAIAGKAFWLTFTGEAVCSIYDCCIGQKGLKHCGQCPELPCALYLESNDPTKSQLENQSILENQLKVLKNLPK